MKISDSTQLALQTIRSNAADKERIIFVSGTFSIVHPGHLRLLRFAAECGDFLVVGVLADSLASSAHLQENIRLEGVSAINWVDHAFVLDSAPANFIEALHPAVVVMGKEHENISNPEQVVVEAYGGQLLYGSGDTIFSSLELLRRETELVNHSSILNHQAERIHYSQWN
jgi:cytidyltransferase-like protein